MKQPSSFPGFTLFTLALACAVFASSVPVIASHSRPNILWLAGENLSHDLGCYGAKNVRTPHLDRLAAEGVRYTNVIATNPACAPSRSAFFTGMYQTALDLHPMRSHRNDAYRLPATTLRRGPRPRHGDDARQRCAQAAPISRHHKSPLP